jgi:tetratricopeptide (TPR) repeat protein
MPDQIFISYRRDDAAYVTGHINDLLRKEFGSESVFTDVDNIALGVDFRQVLDSSVSQCHVLLAVIGEHWLTVKNRDGKLRIHDPADFVRIEIESALKRNIPVIPLLVSGATMPQAEELPDSLKDLAFRNGTQIRPAPDFSGDVDRLIRNLRLYLKSIRDESGDEPGIPLATDPSQSEAAATKQTGTSQEKMSVGEDERARKQAELESGYRPKKKQWGMRLWLLATFGLVAVSWYYVDQNPEKMQAVMTAVQTPKSAGEENLAIGAGAEANRMNNAVGVGEVTVGAPTSFSTAATAGAGEDSAANLNAAAIDEVGNDSEAIQDSEHASDAAADMTVGNTTIDDAESSPEPATDPIGEASANTDAAASLTADAMDEAGVDDELSLTANNITEPEGMVDGEVILTPGSQRQADASEHISEGVSLAAVGEHEAAIQKFDEAVQLDVDAAFVYKQRGASYQALGQLEAAVRDYDEAIQLNGEDMNAYFKRGALHLALEDYAAAVLDYDEVIRLDPELEDAYLKRAGAHEALGNVNQAAQDRAVAAAFESKRNNPR